MGVQGSWERKETIWCW